MNEEQMERLKEQITKNETSHDGQQVSGDEYWWCRGVCGWVWKFTLWCYFESLLNKVLKKINLNVETSEVLAQTFKTILNKSFLQVHFIIHITESINSSVASIFLECTMF